MWHIVFLTLCFFFPAFSHAQYALSICAIFKNEAHFLKEWLEFHKLQGIEHFYLYNNNSTDHYQIVLQPYIKSEEVTLIDWSYTYEPGATEAWLAIQRNAYMDCILKFGRESSWLAFIDSDEFLYCPNGEKLPVFLDRYHDFGGVCVNWVCFGTSDVESIPDNYLMIELLILCGKEGARIDRAVKSIVQPQYVESCPSPHHFQFKEGFFSVSSEGQIVSDWFSSNAIYDQIRINHYWTRTKKYFNECKIPSRNNRRFHDVKKKMKKKADSYNQLEDHVILQFVPALRKQMGLD